MIKKNVLKVGSGFFAGLIINYFFYSYGFLVQTLICSGAVLVLYEGIDRLDRFMALRETLKAWNKEFDDSVKRFKTIQKAESGGAILQSYMIKYAKDWGRLMEDFENE